MCASRDGGRSNIIKMQHDDERNRLYHCAHQSARSFRQTKSACAPDRADLPRKRTSV
jgi:hypothetical protein